MYHIPIDFCGFGRVTFSREDVRVVHISIYKRSDNNRFTVQFLGGVKIAGATKSVSLPIQFGSLPY